jgi:hypothetical protein
LSEHALSGGWTAQFRNSRDRALAAQLLNRLKLVSTREFESAIESALIELQKRVNSTIAVYPIAPPIPGEIVGYGPFRGAILRDENCKSRQAGRRRKYGSEDRVGHLLAKLQDRFKRDSGTSPIECAPTLTHLDSQGIRNIVLVDDICGSGKRITDFWRSVPRRIKSLLSFGRYKLWIVLYAITPKGRTALAKALPNFSIATNLITVLPTADLRALLTDELRQLCFHYADGLGLTSTGFGYRGSSCPIIFEHGCPNNLPVILWNNSKGWKGLFTNRSIPTELRTCFDENGLERATEALWQADQTQLALGLLDAFNQMRRLTVDESLMLTLLGLRLRGVMENDLAKRILLSKQETMQLLALAETMGLYKAATTLVTPVGKEFVRRFREGAGGSARIRSPDRVGMATNSYYPLQCEGKLRQLGKTDRR